MRRFDDRGPARDAGADTSTPIAWRPARPSERWMLGLQTTVGNRAAATRVQRVTRSPPVVARVVGATAVVHEQRGLSADAAETAALVERLIGEIGWQATSAWAYRFINAEPTADLKYGGDTTLIKSCRDTLRAEIERRQSTVKALTGHLTGDFMVAPAGEGAFEAEADKETLDILDRSEEKLRAEMTKYGLKVSGWWPFRDFSMAAGPMQAGIQTSARDLAAHRQRVDALGQTFIDAKKAVEQRWSAGGPAAVPSGSSLLQTVEAARGPWMAAETEYRKACNSVQTTYPILAAYSTGDDAAAKLADLSRKNTGDLAESLYKTIDTRLENIETVRKAIREPGGSYNAWRHPPIIARTKPRLALEPWEERVIEEKALAVRKGGGQEDATTWAVIAIGLGLLSAIPTGGTGLVAGVAAGAAVLSTVYSLSVLYDHYKDYSLASAEHLSTLDQAEAISQEEPSLIWLAWDLLDLGLNLVGAAAAFKTLRTAMLAAEQGGLKALPELIKATDQVGLGVAARSKVVGSVLTKTGRSLDEMLKALHEGLKAAKPTEEKKALLDAIKAAAQRLSTRQIARIGGTAERAQIKSLKTALTGLGKPIEGKLDDVARSLVREFNAGGGTTAGMYFEKFDLIVLRDTEDLVSALTHEMAHRAQSVEGQLTALGTLRSEYQALHMEREILRMLPEDMVLNLDQQLLRQSNDQAIINRIMSDPMYRGLIDAEAAATPGIAEFDPVKDAALIEKWFLGGSAAK